MDIPPLNEIQPYLSAIAAVLGAVTLGIVIRLVSIMQEAAKQRAAVLEERLKSAQDDLERTEKWHERERMRLTQEMEQLKGLIQTSLSDANINFETLAVGTSLQNTTAEIREKIEATIVQMQDTLHKIQDAQHGSKRSLNPDWYLELAKGFMASRAWIQAATNFDEYVKYNPLDWEVHFSRAVAHANSRGGLTTDLAALRAYNEAIAFAPPTIDKNLRARLFSYRGAMLKRLRRLDEAESDLKLALQLAEQKYEKCDVRYNLAGGYALMENRTKLMKMIASLKGCPGHLAAVRNHIHDYFKAFENDKEFLKAVGEHI